MKFNFGTGIFVFMTLFIAALIFFVVFAYRQDVNLVHDNYYEKGVDHSSQMKKIARSASAAEEIEVTDDGNFIRIVFPPVLAANIENGNIMFFRPSDHLRDVKQPLELRGNVFIGSKEQLIPGRYIVKITWQSNSQDFEVNKPLIVK